MFYLCFIRKDNISPGRRLFHLSISPSPPPLYSPYIYVHCLAAHLFFLLLCFLLNVWLGSSFFPTVPGKNDSHSHLISVIFTSFKIFLNSFVHSFIKIFPLFWFVSIFLCETTYDIVFCSRIPRLSYSVPDDKTKTKNSLHAQPLRLYLGGQTGKQADRQRMMNSCIILCDWGGYYQIIS